MPALETATTEEGDDRPTLGNGLFFWLDNGLSRTFHVPDSRGVDGRFPVVGSRPRYGIHGMILVAEERRTPSW